MATPLKNNLDRAAVTRIADAIAAAEPRLQRDEFVRSACRGLTKLELKARIRQIAAALPQAMPIPFAEAAKAICRAADTGDLDIWCVWVLDEFVEQAGLDHLDESLAALAVLTRHASAEFAIRPFIERYPEQTFTQLREWAASDDPALRRLASEGTRPRLPWGQQVAILLQHPSPALELLDRLYDDPDESVRRSVANHLNDISRDDADLALEIAVRWHDRGGQHTDRVLSHGLRTLVKAGDPGALELLGFDPAAAVDVVNLRLAPTRLAVGERLTFGFALVSSADGALDVMVDYVIHHRRANGRTSPKVFKLGRFTLAPRERREIKKSHHIRPITTRRYYPGEHRLELQVNGRVAGGAAFELTALSAAR